MLQVFLGVGFSFSPKKIDAIISLNKTVWLERRRFPAEVVYRSILIFPNNCGFNGADNRWLRHRQLFLAINKKGGCYIN